MLPQLGINIGDYELNILQCKIGLFDREFLVLFGQGLLLVGYDALSVGFISLFFGFVSFVGDLRLAYACPACLQIVWLPGA